jgi:hypothetical protein
MRMAVRARVKATRGVASARPMPGHFFHKVASAPRKMSDHRIRWATISVARTWTSALK